MRTIDDVAEPRERTEWRARTQGEVNFNYDQMPTDVRAIVKRSLVDAQRGLCAYTGVPIDPATSHIEHLKPQAHCEKGEDVAYRNLAACYPGPGVFAPFGAVRKANWPSPQESTLFVSPRSPGCEARFAFSL